MFLYPALTKPKFRTTEMMQPEKCFWKLSPNFFLLLCSLLKQRAPDSQFYLLPAKQRGRSNLKYSTYHIDMWILIIWKYVQHICLLIFMLPQLNLSQTCADYWRSMNTSNNIKYHSRFHLLKTYICFETFFCKV